MSLSEERREMIYNDIDNQGLNDRRGSYRLFEHTAPCLEDVLVKLDACGDVETCVEYVGQYEKRHVSRVVELCQEIAERFAEEDE